MKKTPPKLVRVELDDLGNVIRIFRKDKKWLSCPGNRLGEMSKVDAVYKLRLSVYERSRSLIGPGCERCGRRITWDTMEMHETLPRGKGGEQSLENCEALCRDCHQTGPDAAHKDRKWQTSKISPEGQNGN